jgi:uncharacterized protein (DUF305 family)
MTALSFASMYVVMYANVAAWDHIYPNLNKAYMAALMTAPMLLLALAVMGKMYKDPRWNLGVAALGVAILVGSFLLIRTQGAVGNEQFLRSMIPHHSSAIVMCEQSAITDPEIRELCESIVKTQREEIAQMQDILARLEGGGK